MPPIKIRPDHLLQAVIETGIRKTQHPILEGFWDGGLRDVVRVAIEEAGVCSEELSAVDLARAAGILKKRGPV
jgi:hypothetical protein